MDHRLGRCAGETRAPSMTLEEAGDAEQAETMSRHGASFAGMEAESIYGIGRAIPIQFPKMRLLHCAHCSRRTVAIAIARRPRRCRRRPLSARHGRPAREHPTPMFRGSGVGRRVPPAIRSQARDRESRVARGGVPSSSITLSQPRILPSSTGMWVRNTRSPANRVLVCSSSTERSLSLCAVGQALKVRVREPRSSVTVPSTRSVGGIMRTSSISCSPMIRRNASR